MRISSARSNGQKRSWIYPVTELIEAYKHQCLQHHYRERTVALHLKAEQFRGMIKGGPGIPRSCGRYRFYKFNRQQKQRNVDGWWKHGKAGGVEPLLGDERHPSVYVSEVLLCGLLDLICVSNQLQDMSWNRLNSLGEIDLSKRQKGRIQEEHGWKVNARGGF